MTSKIHPKKSQMLGALRDNSINDGISEEHFGEDCNIEKLTYGGCAISKFDTTSPKKCAVMSTETTTISNWSETLSSLLLQSFESQDHCDLSIQFHDGQIIKVHQFLLELSCNMKAIGVQSKDESRMLQAHQHIQPTVLTSIIRFLYTGCVTTSPSVLEAAELLQVNCLLAALRGHSRSSSRDSAMVPESRPLQVSSATEKDLQQQTVEANDEIHDYDKQGNVLMTPTTSCESSSTKPHNLSKHNASVDSLVGTSHNKGEDFTKELSHSKRGIDVTRYATATKKRRGLFRKYKQEPNEDEVLHEEAAVVDFHVNKTFGNMFDKTYSVRSKAENISHLSSETVENSHFIVSESSLHSNTNMLDDLNPVLCISNECVIGVERIIDGQYEELKKESSNLSESTSDMKNTLPDKTSSTIVNPNCCLASQLSSSLSHSLIYSQSRMGGTTNTAAPIIQRTDIYQTGILSFDSSAPISDTSTSHEDDVIPNNSTTKSLDIIKLECDTRLPYAMIKTKLIPTVESGSSRLKANTCKITDKICSTKTIDTSVENVGTCSDNNSSVELAASTAVDLVSGVNGTDKLNAIKNNSSNFASTNMNATRFLNSDSETTNSMNNKFVPNALVRPAKTPDSLNCISQSTAADANVVSSNSSTVEPVLGTSSLIAAVTSPLKLRAVLVSPGTTQKKTNAVKGLCSKLKPIITSFHDTVPLSQTTVSSLTGPLSEIPSMSCSLPKTYPATSFSKLGPILSSISSSGSYQKPSVTQVGPGLASSSHITLVSSPSSSSCSSKFRPPVYSSSDVAFDALLKGSLSSSRHASSVAAANITASAIDVLDAEGGKDDPNNILLVPTNSQVLARANAAARRRVTAEEARPTRFLWEDSASCLSSINSAAHFAAAASAAAATKSLPLSAAAANKTTTVFPTARSVLATATEKNVTTSATQVAAVKPILNTSAGSYATVPSSYIYSKEIATPTAIGRVTTANSTDTGVDVAIKMESVTESVSAAVATTTSLADVVRTLNFDQHSASDTPEQCRTTDSADDGLEFAANVSSTKVIQSIEGDDLNEFVENASLHSPENYSHVSTSSFSSNMFLKTVEKTKHVAVDCSKLKRSTDRIQRGSLLQKRARLSTASLVSPTNVLPGTDRAHNDRLTVKKYGKSSKANESQDCSILSDSGCNARALTSKLKEAQLVYDQLNRISLSDQSDPTLNCAQSNFGFNSSISCNINVPEINISTSDALANTVQVGSRCLVSSLNYYEIKHKSNAATFGIIPAKTLSLKSSKNTMPSSSFNTTNSEMSNHAKIISEVLKKYPHLVKEKKNLKLKILRRGNNEPVANTSAMQYIVTTDSSGSLKQLLTPCSKPKENKSHKTKLQTVKSRFSCSKCGVSCHTYTLLKQHVLCKHKEQSHDILSDIERKLHGCVLCPDQSSFFFDAVSLDMHKKEKHNKTELRWCHVCGHKPIRKFELAYHLYKEHQIEPPRSVTFPKCDLCEYIGLNKSELLKHRSSHNGGDSFCCSTCSVSFRSFGALQGHLQAKACQRKPSVTHNCPHCNKTFSKSYNLKVHIRSHHRHAGDKLDNPRVVRDEAAVCEPPTNSNTMMSHPNSPDSNAVTSAVADDYIDQAATAAAFNLDPNTVFTTVHSSEVGTELKVLSNDDIDVNDVIYEEVVSTPMGNSSYDVVTGNTNYVSSSELTSITSDFCDTPSIITSSAIAEVSVSNQDSVNTIIESSSNIFKCSAGIDPNNTNNDVFSGGTNVNDIYPVTFVQGTSPGTIIQGSMLEIIQGSQCTPMTGLFPSVYSPSIGPTALAVSSQPVMYLTYQLPGNTDISQLYHSPVALTNITAPSVTSHESVDIKSPEYNYLSEPGTIVAAESVEECSVVSMETENHTRVHQLSELQCSNTTQSTDSLKLGTNSNLHSHTFNSITSESDISFPKAGKSNSKLKSSTKFSVIKHSSKDGFSGLNECSPNHNSSSESSAVIQSTDRATM